MPFHQSHSSGLRLKFPTPLLFFLSLGILMCCLCEIVVILGLVQMWCNCPYYVTMENETPLKKSIKEGGLCVGFVKHILIDDVVEMHIIIW